MSYRNYNKTSEKNSKESINLDKPSFETNETDDNLEILTPSPEITVHLPRSANGVVTGCGRLNLRTDSNIQSEVITELDSGTIVVVTDIDVYSEWFEVTIADGRTGFCMKKFIQIDS